MGLMTFDCNPDLVTNLELEAERKYAALPSTTSTVEIKKGHARLVRFLPFPQGPAKQPFVRIARHHIGGYSFLCKRHTAAELGGDLEAACAVCDLAEHPFFDAEPHTLLGTQAQEHYRGYCLVFGKENPRGWQDNTPWEMTIPHEFLIPKPAFPVLIAEIDRSTRCKGASPLGLLDLMTGTELWVGRDMDNDLFFEIAESGPEPVFTLDEHFEARLQKVWKQLKQPTVKWLSNERLSAIAEAIMQRVFEK